MWVTGAVLLRGFTTWAASLLADGALPVLDSAGAPAGRAAPGPAEQAGREAAADDHQAGGQDHLTGVWDARVRVSQCHRLSD
jgi:hypothetical protein